MRRLSSVLVVSLVVATPLAATGAATAKAKPRADLVSKHVTATYAEGRVTASATIKNKGRKRSRSSVAAFYLSADRQRSGDDTTLGTSRVRRVKPKRSKPVSGTFRVPASVAPGTYHVVVCADSRGRVKERKETNNCKGSVATVTLSGGTGPGGGPVTISATADAGGTVAPSAVTGGSCVASTCTFPTPGTGTVTFTPTPAAGYRFGTWTGTTCSGYTTGSGGKITFTKPTTAKACTATFVKQVTVTYVVAPVSVSLVGKVSGVATGGSCTDDLVSGGGSCVVDAVTGTVTLTATALALPFFDGWSGPGCASLANPLALSNLTTNLTCTATFGLT